MLGYRLIKHPRWSKSYRIEPPGCQKTLAFCSGCLGEHFFYRIGICFKVCVLFWSTVFFQEQLCLCDSTSFQFYRAFSFYRHARQHTWTIGDQVGQKWQQDAANVQTNINSNRGLTPRLYYRIEFCQHDNAHCHKSFLRFWLSLGTGFLFYSGLSWDTLVTRTEPGLNL